MPQRWNELYNLLPERRQVGAGWEPPLPLILMASYESDMSKMNRLQVHIEWAAAHDALHQVADYLRGLPEEEWFHIGG